MGKIVRKETRKRGFFGWIALIVFLVFNVLMAIGVYGGLTGVAKVPAATEAAQAGRAIGGTIGMGMILGIWVMGDIILGAFVLLTRGSKVIVEETVD